MGQGCPWTHFGTCWSQQMTCRSITSRKIVLGQGYYLSFLVPYLRGLEQCLPGHGHSVDREGGREGGKLWAFLPLLFHSCCASAFVYLVSPDCASKLRVQVLASLKTSLTSSSKVGWFIHHYKHLSTAAMSISPTVLGAARLTSSCPLHQAQSPSHCSCLKSMCWEEARGRRMEKGREKGKRDWRTGKREGGREKERERRR